MARYRFGGSSEPLSPEFRKYRALLGGSFLSSSFLSGFFLGGSFRSDSFFSEFFLSEQLQAKDEELKAKNEKIIECFRENRQDLLEIAKIRANAHKPHIYTIHIEATGNKFVSEAKKEYNFHAPVGSVGNEGTQKNVAGVVEGDQIGTQHNYAPEQKQTLAEAAVEIQKLLKQLEETNPTATQAEQQAYVTASIPPTLRRRFVSALQAGWKEAIKEFLDNPYVNVGVAILEGWQEAE